MPTGQILVGRKGGFDICNNDGTITKSIDVEIRYGSEKLDIISIQYHETDIYTLGIEPDQNAMRYFVMLKSEDYSKEGEWALGYDKKVCHMAVVDNKVYLSDPENKQLLVYSLTGREITNIKLSTFIKPLQLCLSGPNSIIISDGEANKVHKLDGNSDAITWTCTDVKDPSAVCCDAHGDVWVWSRDTQSIFLLASDSG